MLTLVGVCVDSGPAPYILMPFMSNGSLLSYLTKENHNLTVAEGSDQELVSPVQKQRLSQCANSTMYYTIPFHSPAFNSPDDVLLEENADIRPSFAELEMTLTSILEPLSDYTDFSTLYYNKKATIENTYIRNIPLIRMFFAL